MANRASKLRLKLAAAPALSITIKSLKPGGGKVRGAGAQQPPVDLVALEVHQVATLALDRYLDARRLGEVTGSIQELGTRQMSFSIAYFEIAVW